MRVAVSDRISDPGDAGGPLKQPLPAKPKKTHAPVKGNGREKLTRFFSAAGPCAQTRQELKKETPAQATGRKTYSLFFLCGHMRAHMSKVKRKKTRFESASGGCCRGGFF